MSSQFAKSAAEPLSLSHFRFSEAPVKPLLGAGAKA
jgi:hypothetical protein